MPFNPDGSFTLAQEFGTGVAPDNQLPPKIGAALDDIAASIDANNLFGTVSASVAATFASVSTSGPISAGGSISAGTSLTAGGNAVFVQTQVASGGVTWSTFDHGTVSSGTIFPSAAVCLKQQVTNNGAFVISASSIGVGDVEVLIVNASSAGTITFSGFTKQFTSDSLNTTNANAFVGYLYGFAGSRTAYIIKALQ